MRNSAIVIRNWLILPYGSIIYSGLEYYGARPAENP